MSIATEVCENCGRAIGKLETPRLHEAHVVCARCWEHLAGGDGGGDVSAAIAAELNARPADESPAAIRARMNASQTLPYAALGRAGPQLIEQTSKAFKAQMLFASLTAIIGVVLLMVGLFSESRLLAVPGFFMLPIGLVWFVYASIAAWWAHG